MDAEYLLGLDIGNRSVRCLLGDINTNHNIVTRRAWQDDPLPGGGWAFDLDPNLAWKLSSECIKEALEKKQAHASQVLGVAVTGVRHVTIVVDKDQKVMLAASGRDARSATQSSELGRLFGEDFYRDTGHWPLPISHASRLSWMKETSPQIFTQIAHVFGLCEWVTHRLCGEIVSEASLASESMLFDLSRNDWSAHWIDRLGFSRDWFPMIAQAGTCVGKLDPSAASELGLHAGTPVAMGCGDTQSGLLGLGAIHPRDCAVILGTTAPIQYVIDTSWIDPSYHLWTSRHPKAGCWIIESNAGSLGEALEYGSQLLFPEAHRPINRLIGEASLAAPGAEGIISTFGAQVFDAHQASAPVGHFILNQFIGGYGAHRRENLCRAILEGMAYGLRANLNQIASQFGQPTHIALAGGVSQNKVFTQLLSDVLGIPVQVAEAPEASALGAAICAGVGSGIYPDLDSGAKHLVHPLNSYQPDAQISAYYQDSFRDWINLVRIQSTSDDFASNMVIEPMMSQLESEAKTNIKGFQPRFLVTAQMDETSLADLRQLGEVTYASYRDEMRLLTGDELTSQLQGYQVFVTEVDVVDQEALQNLPDLRLIVSCRGNAVNVDLSTCSALGIPVLNAPGRNADAVAELTLAFMMNLGRKLDQANHFLRQPGGEAGDMGRMGHAHNELIGLELWGKTIGLIGLGAVGKAVVHRLTPFHVNILAFDPYVTPEEAGKCDVELVNLERLLKESDFVSLHAAVTEQTRGLIDAEKLAIMKPGSYLINTARAALIDEKALLDSLSSGHLAGAALDVFAIEPPAADDPLLVLPNVLATPHIGGNTAEVGAHQGQIILSDLRRMISGQAPNHILNPETLQKFNWEGLRQTISLVGAMQSIKPFSPAVSDIQGKRASINEGTARDTEEAVRSDQRIRAETKESLSSSAIPSISTREASSVKLNITSQEIRQTYEKLIQNFIDLACKDPMLLAYAAKHNVTTHYTVSDLGVQYYIGFAQGKVIGGLGAPAETAEVRMKATAHTFDSIFTGQINGNKAAMSGKLSFSGDVRIAMGVQKIQADLIRLYTEARQTMDNMPDLTNITAALPAGSRPAVKIVQDASDLRQELVQTIQELFQMQVITATGGNLSVRIPDTDQAWVTPSQLYKGDLKPEVMVRIDLEGNALDPDALAPSSERLVHTEIYKSRPEVQAIIHAHAPYTTILGLSKLPFLPITTDAAFIKELPRVPFIMPGTRELAEAVAKALGKNPAVIMQNHGVVIAASSLRRASNLLEAVERNCQLILGSYAVGKKPPTLPKDVIKQLQEIGEMMA